MEKTIDDFKDGCYCGDKEWQSFTNARLDESLLEYARRMGYTTDNAIVTNFKVTYKKNTTNLTTVSPTIPKIKNNITHTTQDNKKPKRINNKKKPKNKKHR